MIATTSQPDTNLAAFERIYAHALDRSAAWFRPQREQAFARFAELGLPTAKWEDWRFANIGLIRSTVLAAAAPGTTTPVPETAAVTARDLSPFEIDRLQGPRLVFVNGRYDAGLSHLPDFDDGIQVLPLTAAFHSHSDLLEEHLTRLADYREQPLTALNTALAADGVVVYVQRNKVLAAPIHVIHVTAPTAEPILISPRSLIVVEDGAEATVVEDHVSLRRDVYFTNAVTEVVVGANAKANHYLLQRGSTRAFHVSSLHVHQKRDSRFNSHSVILGGRVVRNNVLAVLDGVGCESLLNGLYVIDGEQTADNHMRVEHAQPQCHSRQFYKGIMSGKSRGVFRGRIVVHPDAQQTNAEQSNQNLLLSDDASANTDPQLEIYADDVRCTHGATIGQLDEDQVFYLMSRGVSEATARAMITHAFAGECLKRMENEAIREMLRCMLNTRLPEAKAMEQSL